MRTPAVTTTRNCRSRFRSHPRLDAGYWCGRVRALSEIRRVLAGGLVKLCDIDGASGVHVTFATEPEFRFLGELGFLQRTDQQFHWVNPGYQSFDDFLGALSSRKRKTIRRERADALASGVSVHWLTGRDLTEDIWDNFFTFYMETGSRKWGRPYLTRPFFSHRRNDARSHSFGDGQAQRTLDRRCHQFYWLAHVVRPPLGSGIETIHSCISRSATIRRSNAFPVLSTSK